MVPRQERLYLDELPAPPPAPPSGRIPAQAALAAGPVAVLGAGVAAALAGGPWYMWLVREDGVAENAQVLACAAAALVAAAHAARAWRRGRRRRAAAWAALALALVFVIGEELSWGQRVVGWSTPAALAERNRQQESNVHNVAAVEPLFRAALIAALACAGVGPWLRWLRGAGAGAAAVPLVVTPYFLVPLAGHVAGMLYEPPARYVVAWREGAELMELIAYLGVLWAVVLARRDAGP